MEEEFKPISTSEEFSAAMKPHLEQAAAAAAQKFAGYIPPEDAAKTQKALDDKIAALNDKITAHEATIADLTAKNKAHEVAAMKTRIAQETGLSLDLASRLCGETEADIKADAEKLAGLMKANQPATPLYSPQTPVSSAALHDAAFLSMVQELNK